MDGGPRRVDVTPASAPVGARGESATITTRDGVQLGATVFAPAEPPRAIAVVAPAMAVLQRMYRAFAGTLASRGIATVTFDYRGVGESKPPRLRGFHATATDWARLDLPAAIDFARERFGAPTPTFLVGHSIGGQILGLCPRAPSLTGAVLVAAQSGYWKNWSGVPRALMLLNWHLMPLIARATGYLPMAAVRQGENVPLGVALEWASWGRHPRYILSSPQAEHGSLEIPIRAYLISDDGFAPPASVRALVEFHARAPIELKELGPSELGTRAIGHFGIFRREFKATFHEEVAEWILSRAGGKRDVS